MNRIDRFERELPEALGDVAGPGAPDYLADILGRTARTRQRPAWASLERWLPMELVSPRAAAARVPWRTLGVLALIALLLAGLLAAYVGSQRRLPQPFGPARNGLIPFERDGDILVGDPATGDTRLVSGGPERDYAPSFSPDGSQIGFLRASDDCPTPGDVCPGGEEIVVINPDGSGARTLTPAPLIGIRVATWAPDSRGLLVGFLADGTHRLAVVPTDGSAPRVIADDVEADWALYRPPVGDEILIRGLVAGRLGLFRMDADGSGLRLLAPGTTGQTLDGNQDLNFPAYSPDGSRIYYNRYVPEHQTIEAWVMAADGSAQRRFNADATVTGWWEGEMAPSPDGKWVVMWRVPGDGGGSRVTLYPADGSGPGRIVGPDVRGTARWAWSPDSTRLLLNPNDASEGGQVLIDPSTGAWTETPWKVNAEPDWQRLAP